MLKAYRLRNALLSGMYTSSTLNTLLQQGQAYKTAMQMVFNDRVWLEDVLGSAASASVVLGASQALDIITSSAAITNTIWNSENILNCVLESPPFLLKTWESESFLSAVQRNKTARSLFLAKSTRIKTHKDRPGRPEGKIILLRAQFDRTGHNCEIITRAGGSINATPIKDTTTAPQIVFQAINDLNFTQSANWVDVDYIKV